MKKSVTQIMQEEMKNKIGLDLDLDNDNNYYYPKDLKILMFFFNITYLFPNANIKIYKSSSEKGYHFEIEDTKNIKHLSNEIKWKIRESLGDCSGRLEFAKFRDYDDVLFDFKLQEGGKMCKRRKISEKTLLGLYNERLLFSKNKDVLANKRNF